MKKVIIIIVAVILVIALVVGGAVFMLTRPKVAIDVEKFKAIAEEKGYTVGDVQSQFTDYDYIDKAQVAVSNDYSYLIEFYMITNDESTKTFYSNNKATLNAMKQDNAIYTETSGKNYETYSLKSGGKYMYIARVDNTIVYVNANDSAEEAIKEFVKALGY